MNKKQLINALIATQLSDDTPVLVTYVGDDAESGTDMYRFSVQIAPTYNMELDGSETEELEICIEAIHLNHSPKSDTL